MQTTRSRNSLERMIQRQVIDRGIKDPRVLEALRAVPRELFFAGDGDAYADNAAPIGHGQTISQPYIVALMTESLDVRPTDRVLEIGTGSGYQTAILAKLAAEVWTIERIKPLLDAAFERVLSSGATNIRFRHGDGTLGWPESAPFDRILIAAGAPEIPRSLLASQLTEGGIAVLPTGADDAQKLVKVTRQGNDLKSEAILPVRFVRLVGKEGWPEAE